MRPIFATLEYLSSYAVPAIAAIGGIARRLNDWISGDSPFHSVKMVVGELIARVVIAVFCGFVCVWLAEATYVSENGRYLAAALGGWSGGETMSWITRAYEKRLRRLMGHESTRLHADDPKTGPVKRKEPVTVTIKRDPSAQ